MLGEPFNENALLKHSKEVNPEIIVTLGENGCAEVSGGKVHIHQAKKVTAIDTTGAGDAFVGSFSYGLACKMSKQLCRNGQRPSSTVHTRSYFKAQGTISLCSKSKWLKDRS